jgi:4-hydroxy-3-methylbut-2-en-1-yl diphosphate reductase
MKQFDVPVFYRSPIISTVKDARKSLDPRKKDLTPSVIDFGPVRFKIARHFGFCYGVENAIEIAYKALDENPDKRVFLLSEMIHNPHVNNDLQKRGIQFLRTTSGKQLVPFDELTSDDVVIIPAFGTTLEVEQTLEDLGVDTATYDTTCPFVEKVWRKSKQIGEDDYSIIVHGKRYHEETRATFSHAKEQGPVVVIRDMGEAEKLARVIRGDKDADYFFEHFDDKYSDGFDPDADLQRLGVVNQTTMLATETKAIANLLREAVIDRYGEDTVSEHFAETSDTLCYATTENQDATLRLIEDGADLGIIVGGYNSSNTSHLVELCEEYMPTYFIRGASEFDTPTEISHFDLHAHEVTTTEDWFPIDDTPVDVVLTSGASCPDALLDEVIRKMISWFPDSRPVEEALAPFDDADDE